MSLEPLERGSGVVYEDKTVGGVIPRQFIPSVEKGVRQALDNGSIGGFPMVDLKVSLVDGSFHTVDSSDIAFSSAAMMAIREGVPRGRPVLLEPIVDMEVVCPGENLGRGVG